MNGKKLGGDDGLGGHRDDSIPTSKVVLYRYPPTSNLAGTSRKDTPANKLMSLPSLPRSDFTTKGFRFSMYDKGTAAVREAMRDRDRCGRKSCSLALLDLANVPIWRQQRKGAETNWIKSCSRRQRAKFTQKLKHI